MALRFSPRFKKKLTKKPAEQQGAILTCVKRLGDNPRHPGLHTHRVKGTDSVWEAYVNSGDRVTFHYEAGDLVLRKHCNHDEVLRNP